MEDDWSLCVGIGKYGDAKLDPLPGALNDARALHAWLTAPDGGAVPLPQAELILSPDAGARSPTAADVEDRLRAFYARAVQRMDSGQSPTAGRRLWLFYSGHGVGFREEEDTGLLTGDARPSVMDYSHVAGRAWVSVFRALAVFQEVILFMDCCRADIGRTPLRRPPVRTLYVDPPGRMMAAYSVANGKVAFENTTTGVPRGEFSVALEALLRNPPQRPLSARRFLELLEQHYPGVDPDPPRALRDDFELISGPSTPAPPSLLIAHGETTHGLAVGLASKLRSPEGPPQVRWAHLVSNESGAFAAVKQLVVTRDVDLVELRRLVTAVEPERTVLFSTRDPGVAALERVRFVPRPDNAEACIEDCAKEVDAALAGAVGRLRVSTQEGLAQVRVWNAEGRLVGAGRGELNLSQLPEGRYRVRASLGACHRESSLEVRADALVDLELPALAPPLPGRGSLASVAEGFELTPGRLVFRAELATGARVFVSTPKVAGWRTEVFTQPSTSPTMLSVRLVPERLPEGAPYPTDALRASLELALQAPTWTADDIAPSEVRLDPVAALLCATLRLRNGHDATLHLEAAAAVLGEADPDIRLLTSEGAPLGEPPLLAFPWHLRLRQGALECKPGSLAMDVTGRLWMVEPWFAWTDQIPNRVWLPQVATAAWPGWDRAPDPALALESLDQASLFLGAAPASVRHRAFKAPPIDRLVQHQRVAFVGATNDQLPAALAVAFVARLRRRWDRIELWSLTDEALDGVVSSGRMGAELQPARDLAEQQLAALLPHVTVAWSLKRYAGMELAGRRVYASLWDWERVGGFVHASAAGRGEELRTAPAEDLVWSDGSAPPAYARVVQAFAELAPAGASRTAADLR